LVGTWCVVFADFVKTENYEEGQLTRFMSVEYKSDLRRDGNDYLSKNAEQEVSVLFINPLKLPSNRTFNTITMGFIVSRLNAFIINRSGGVVFLGNGSG
jgi:hypothetical protein